MDTDKKAMSGKHVGIGGWHCQCCAPYSKPVARRHSRRTAKQRVKAEIKIDTQS
jgi:hypothetical protein